MLLHEVTLQRPVHLLRSDPTGIERFIGHTEELRQRRADLRGLDLEARHQHALNRLRLLSGFFDAHLQFCRRHHAVVHEAVVLRGAAPVLVSGLLHPLADGCRQCLAQLGSALDFEFAEGLIALVVDDLEHTVQRRPVHDRYDEHLLRAIAGTLVDLFQEAQCRIDALECFVVVDVADVQHLPAHGGIAGKALCADRQLQVAAGIQARLDLGHDGALVFVDGIERQAIGVEQLADVLARIEHDLFDVLGFVNPRRDLLQLTVEQCLERDPALVRREHLRAEKRLLSVLGRPGRTHRHSDRR